MNVLDLTAFTQPIGDGWYVQFIEKRPMAVDHYGENRLWRSRIGLMLYSPLFATQAEVHAYRAEALTTLTRLWPTSLYRATVHKAVAGGQDSSTRTPA